MLLNGLGDVCTIGLVEILTNLLILIPFNPRIFGVVETCQRVLNNLEALAALANAYQLTGLDAIRRDSYYLTIDHDVLVVDKLTGLKYIFAWQTTSPSFFLTSTSVSPSLTGCS